MGGRGAAGSGPRLLLLVLLVAAAWPTSAKPQTIEQQLIKWVISKGGKVRGFKVGQACETCPRGTIATKDLKPGDTIVKVPFEPAVLRLKDRGESMFPAEFARDLLDSVHNDPNFNETWRIFWTAMAGTPDSHFTPDVYTNQHLTKLQCAELADLARGQREVTEQVYLGTYPYAQYAPFKETVPEDKVSLDTFKWVAAMICSRYFGFYRDGNQAAPASHLVPVVDLINHADDPNAERSDDGKNVLVKVIKPIKKGEEITNNYQPNVVHRPDMSLYIYGFVIPREQPFLAAVDLPSYNSSNPFDMTAPDDSAYEDPESGLVTTKELARLKARLASCPTSEEEDMELLEGGTITDWRERAILQFRVMRKRALRLTIAKLDAALSGKGSGAAKSAGAKGKDEGAHDEAEKGSQDDEDDDMEFDDEAEDAPKDEL